MSSHDIRGGHLSLPCPICNRFRVEWTLPTHNATEHPALLLNCSKCGADHITIADEAIRLSEEREEREAQNTESRP